MEEESFSETAIGTILHGATSQKTAIFTIPLFTTPLHLQALLLCHSTLLSVTEHSWNKKTVQTSVSEFRKIITAIVRLILCISIGKRRNRNYPSEVLNAKVFFGIMLADFNANWPI
jgi:hypothetical protein